MSGPRYDLVPRIGTERAGEPEPQTKTSAPGDLSWGKILFSAAVALLTGLIVHGALR